MPLRRFSRSNLRVTLRSASYLVIILVAEICGQPLSEATSDVIWHLLVLRRRTGRMSFPSARDQPPRIRLIFAEISVSTSRYPLLLVSQLIVYVLVYTVNVSTHTQTQILAKPMSASKAPSRLRSTCDACSTAKVKCDKKQPTCDRCRTNSFRCSYSPSRRHGSTRGRGYPNLI